MHGVNGWRASPALVGLGLVSAEQKLKRTAPSEWQRFGPGPVFGSRRCLPKRSGGFAGLVSLPAALALLLSLVGCQSQRQTLHVVIVPNSRLEWLQRDGKDRIAWTPLLQEYQRLHPGLQLQVSVVDEAHLEETLRRDRSVGAGSRSAGAGPGGTGHHR